MLLFTRAALAWGPVGHQVVAYIAEDNLTPVAKRRVAEILGPDLDLAHIANWADQVRATSRSETASWHFIDIDVRAKLAKSDEARFCLNGNCVVARIDADIAVLKNRTANTGRKLEALKFLVHFVGDVHQPLHCANDGDHGGNDKVVRYVRPGSRRARGTKIKLHALWDHLIELKPIEDPRELASKLEQKITPERKAEWSKGVPADWAWESYAIAHEAIYWQFSEGATDSDGVPLPQSYYSTDMRDIVDIQLERAGIRLAHVLNDIFR